MKCIGCLVVFMHLLFHTCFGSGIEINGTYKQSENWDGDTLNVTGNITVILLDKEKIVIKPGTVVLFHGPYSIATANANLIFNGSDEQPITFTADDTATGWGGVHFDRSLYMSLSSEEVSQEDLLILMSSVDMVNISYCSFRHCSNRSVLTGRHKWRISNCSFIDNHGLGIDLFANSPEDTNYISDCLFENNNGGALCCKGGNVKLERNRFYRNVRTVPESSENDNVGGIYMWGCNGIIDNNIFEENSGFGYASALFRHGDDTNTIIISNCTFHKNYGVGAIQLMGGNATISGNTFTGNINTTCQIGGATLYLNGAPKAVISANVFSENIDSCTNTGATSSGGASGGALYITAVSNLTVANNLFTGNHALRGGALFCTSADTAVFINNTFTGNTGWLSSAIYNDYPGRYHRYINNCIYGNNVVRTDDSLVYQVFLDERSDAEFINCLICPEDSVYLSERCVDCVFGIPQFNDTSENDFSLKMGSPGIDEGFNDVVDLLAGSTDLAGNPRVYNDSIDIGAYEFQNSTPVQLSENKKRVNNRRKTYTVTLFNRDNKQNAYLLNGILIRKNSPQNRIGRSVVTVRQQ